MKTIAVVDDDIYIGNMLEEVLQQNGYAVLRAYSGTEAVLLLSNSRPDLVLLDLMLPGLSGEEVLPCIQNIPVIILSAKINVEDKVKLLLGGAADYMTKPFDTKELLARIAVQLRKVNLPTDGKICVGTLAMDVVAHQASYDQTPLKLTKTEFAILKLLMENPDRPISKGTILEKIALDTPDCTEDSLKQHISNLRLKLHQAGGKDMIVAVWGIGYKLVTK